MRILSYGELKPQKGIRWTRTHLRRLVAEGRFPAPVELSGHTIGWLESEVDQYIKDRAAEREDNAA